MQFFTGKWALARQEEGVGLLQRNSSDRPDESAWLACQHWDTASQFSVFLIFINILDDC
jgi:hypothetical protein